MKKCILMAAFAIFAISLFSQSVQLKLQNAFAQFEKDDQLKNAISSLYVVDASSGAIVFDKNSMTGLAPASTQKLLTAAAAFDLLGPDYRYKTTLEFQGAKAGNILRGNLLIRGSGDPTLGSFRFQSSAVPALLARWVDALKKAGVDSITGNILSAENNAWSNQITPEGWLWQDIGNYYGAGAGVLNWNENQFDLYLKAGRAIGDRVQILGTDPPLPDIRLESEVLTGTKESGDNAYIHLPPYTGFGIVTGTIPIGSERFKISGALPSPARTLLSALGLALTKAGITVSNRIDSGAAGGPGTNVLQTTYSPRLDSIVYWFLKKSINLYGEAILKTISFSKSGSGSTAAGIGLLKDYWQQKGIDIGELNIYDGSGLSPLNRITTHAEVEVLRYARKQNWFPAFLAAFPEYNSMKLKSGTISDVKGFCGYHKSREGKEYLVSFLVNNYSGPAASLVNKMYRVLDILK